MSPSMTNTSERPEAVAPQPPVAPELAHEIWEAESGRCESCNRPMDVRCARIWHADPRKDGTDPNNLRLLCPNCWRQRPSPFLHGLDQSRRTPANRILPQTVLATLGTALDRYGVVVRVYEHQPSLCTYWLPGVGTFLVLGRAQKPARLCRYRLYRDGELVIRAPERTRGLPRVQIAMR